MTKRKLIEVALPLEAINKEAAREKSIRHGHPSTLHLWWARRPLAAARAVLFAQLVDDPASRPEAEQIADPDERDEWVRAERSRLFRMIEELVKWENINDDSLFKAAHEEILRSTDGNPPPILDPFAGGGSIPLEAQRLGLEAHASDLNPVAVLINKALIEIPPKFAGRAPVFPGAAEAKFGDWPRATGLAEDVRRYGQWMRDEAEKHIGHLYPKAKLKDGTEATMIAWIWARTVTCPNPACGIEMPLVRSWWLGKKKGKEAYVTPVVADGPDGAHVEFRIGHDLKQAPTKDTDGTVGRTGATCIACDTTVPLKYIRTHGQEFGLGSTLMAIVAEGKRARIYLPPSHEHIDAADVEPPLGVPTEPLPANPRDFKTPNYGLTTFASLFTNRQLTVLTTLTCILSDVREKVLSDGCSNGMVRGKRLACGGVDAAAYADSIQTYLGFAISKFLARNNTMCGWESGMDRLRGSFQRQAIPMTWDFVEAHPLSDAGGGFMPVVESEAEVLDKLPMGAVSNVQQVSADACHYGNYLVSTDPPYYDNVGYSELSDFFYVWLRKSLAEAHPDTLATLLAPKAGELVANPYRHDGKDAARSYFERGFYAVFSRARANTVQGYPITVYYAFKQSESGSDGNTSTGWETLLEGMIRSGWLVTGTWPVRSEMSSRMLSSGTNALASCVVLSLRPRPENASSTERRAFLNELRDELPGKLWELQQASIAPVDLAQAAIGPGMAVFSRCSEVIEPDGERMSVRKALGLINQVLAEVLGEQEGNFDADTRWCLKWFQTHGFEPARYGEAESLAVAMNTSVSGLDRSGAVRSRAGKVALVHPDNLRDDYDPRRDNDVTLWEVTLHMAKALDSKGIDAAGAIMARAGDRIDVDAAKELAYLAFSIANDKGWSQIAQLYNVLGTTWPEVVAAARSHRDDRGEQGQLDLDALY